MLNTTPHSGGKSSVELFSGGSSIWRYLAVWSGVCIGKRGVLCDCLQTRTKSCGHGARNFEARFEGNRTKPAFADMSPTPHCPSNPDKTPHRECSIQTGLKPPIFGMTPSHQVVMEAGALRAYISPGRQTKVPVPVPKAKVPKAKAPQDIYISPKQFPGCMRGSKTPKPPLF